MGPTLVQVLPPTRCQDAGPKEGGSVRPVRHSSLMPEPTSTCMATTIAQYLIDSCLMGRILLTGKGRRQTRRVSHCRYRFDYFWCGDQTYPSARSSVIAV